MPRAEVDVDIALVRSLLRHQMPDLADLTIAPLAEGWDNAIFRLGAELVVRLPRREVAVELLEHELRWLPELAPVLPLRIPAPVRAGHPDAGYPWPWSVCPWLPGEVAERAVIDDVAAAATAMGRFVAALHRPAPADAPRNPVRGVPLGDRSTVTLERIDTIADLIDASAARSCWDHLVATPAWAGPPVWVHGDLHPLNILVDNGQVSAVIDFGDLNAGDPATDLSMAWMLFPPDLRAVFRAAAGDVDDDTWHRARGWALALSLAYIANSSDHPAIAQIGARTIAAVLDDADQS
jgi:aminoglycoside phosphotransferase (APT) family kinase protein